MPSFRIRQPSTFSLCVTIPTLVLLLGANLLAIFSTLFLHMELQKSAPTKYCKKIKIKRLVALKYFVIKCTCVNMLDILLTCEKYLIYALEKCPTSGRIWLNNKYCDYLIHGHGGIFSILFWTISAWVDLTAKTIW